jgi:hypothetical protein
VKNYGIKLSTREKGTRHLFPVLLASRSDFLTEGGFSGAFLASPLLQGVKYPPLLSVFFCKLLAPVSVSVDDPATGVQTLEEKGLECSEGEAFDVAPHTEYLASRSPISSS